MRRQRENRVTRTLSFLAWFAAVWLFLASATAAGTLAAKALWFGVVMERLIP